MSVYILVCIYFLPHNVWVDAKEVLKAVSLNVLPEEEIGIDGKGQVDAHYDKRSSIHHILHVPGPLHVGL